MDQVDFSSNSGPVLSADMAFGSGTPANVSVSCPHACGGRRTGQARPWWLDDGGRGRLWMTEDGQAGLPLLAPHPCFSFVPALGTLEQTLFTTGLPERLGCPCPDVCDFPESGTGPGRAEGWSENLPPEAVSPRGTLPRVHR